MGLEHHIKRDLEVERQVSIIQNIINDIRKITGKCNILQNEYIHNLFKLDLSNIDKYNIKLELKEKKIKITFHFKEYNL